MSETALYLKSLDIRNFRGFEKLRVELHPEFNLVLGANGAGKTSLVDALAAAMRFFIRQQWGPILRRSDIRRVLVSGNGAPTLDLVEPCTIDAEALALGWTPTWSISINSVAGATQKLDQALQAWWRLAQQEEAHRNPVDLPVLACFASTRSWNQLAANPKDMKLPPRDVGWRNWWQPSTTFAETATWIRRQTFADLQTKTALPQLAAVKKAVIDCLGDVSDFFYDIRTEQLRVSLDDGSHLPLSMLSDGYRNIVAMVVDLAWRAVTLNPRLGVEAPARSPGVVLIDEIDLHLHPSWQRRVIGDLRRVFPAMQFVATTHSPQVLASAKREWVRMLDGSPVAREVGPVQGRDSNSLLEDIFGDSDRPKGERNAIAGLFEHIDRGQWPEAREALDRLELQLGPDDPEMIRARWKIEIEEA